MDLNSDGHPDILSGSYSGDGLKEMAGLFQVLWGQEGGKFKKAEPLKGSDGKLLIIKPAGEGGDADLPRICTRPTAVDWNADGHLDLVVGNFEGTFYLFEGEGGGKFKPESQKLMQDKKPLKIGGYHSDPFFVDFDADGDLDLLSGNAGGGVEYAENSAGPGKPILLKSFVNLTTGGGGADRWFDEKPKVGGSTRVWADDLNGDGKLDLIVGDNATVKAPAKGADKKQTEKKLEQWGKEMSDLQKKAETANSDGDFSKKFQAHWESRGGIINETRAGFVWVYYQK